MYSLGTTGTGFIQIKSKILGGHFESFNFLGVVSHTYQKFNKIAVILLDVFLSRF